MSDGTVLSVVVPAHNAERTVGACLDSLQQQSMPRGAYGIIVVDDESTDGTRDVAELSPDVRVVSQPRAGPAAARNRGAAEARGEYLVFVDADCEADHDFLRAITAPMEADPDVAGVQGRYRSRQRSVVARFVQIEIEERYALMEKRAGIDHIGTYAAAFRRRVFLDHGGFDAIFPEASNEDMEFSYRLVSAGHGLRLARNAFCYHRHPETLRRYIRAKFRHAYWTAILYGRHRDKILKDSYRPKSLRFQVLSLVGLPLVAGAAGLLTRSLVATLAVCVAYLGIFLCLPMLPLVARALRRDVGAGLLAPIIVGARAAAGASGLVIGILRTSGLWRSGAAQAKGTRPPQGEP